MRKLFDHECRSAETKGYCQHLTRPERMILDQFFAEHGVEPPKRTRGFEPLYPNPLPPRGPNWRARVSRGRLRRLRKGEA